MQWLGHLAWNLRVASGVMMVARGVIVKRL